MSIYGPLRIVTEGAGGVQNPIPSGTPLTPKQYVYITLHLAPPPRAGGDPIVTATGSPTLPGDDPLTIRIYADSVVAFTLDTSNADWEFSHAGGVSLATQGASGIRYHNLFPAPGSTPSGVRSYTASFEATYFQQSSANKDGYNLNFMIWRGADGTVYENGRVYSIDPDIKNPGNYGLILAST
jgi:hypothetical protein